MEQNAAVEIFSALGHPGRLAVFRLLMRLSPVGGRPTDIAQALGLKQNTLSHHLADLERCGLVQSLREGRSLRYSVDLDRAAGLATYLVGDCCRGHADILCAVDGTTANRVATAPPYHVLFLCSANSARSIFAEAILRGIGGDRFSAHSAGTRPGGGLNPDAVAVLARNGFDITALRSKPVAEFQRPDAPKFDFVFTVCDAAAAEDCAPWPGQPVTAHWGVADPAKATGTPAERALAFAAAFAELHRRITAFSALSVEQLDRMALQHHVDDIGRL